MCELEHHNDVPCTIGEEHKCDRSTISLSSFSGDDDDDHGFDGVDDDDDDLYIICPSETKKLTPSISYFFSEICYDL